LIVNFTIGFGQRYRAYLLKLQQVGLGFVSYPSPDLLYEIRVLAKICQARADLAISDKVM